MNLARAIGVGAIGILAISGWTYFTNLRNKRPPPTKQETLEILQAVRQQFYPVLIKIATRVTKQLAPQGLTPSENQTIIMNDPAIKQQIEKINDKLYDKFSEDEIKQAVENDFKDDNDIQHHRKEFEEEYKKSLMGVMPERQIIISRRLNKQKVLKAIKEILQSKVCQDSGKIDRLTIQIDGKFDQKQIGDFLQSDVEEDGRITKQIIKKELGLVAKDSIKIFHYAVMQYKKEPKFNEEYESITSSYSKKIKQLLPS